MGEASSTAELTVEDIQSQLSEEERLSLFSTDSAPHFVRGLRSQEARVGDNFRFTVQGMLKPRPVTILSLFYKVLTFLKTFSASRELQLILFALYVAQ